MRKIFFLLFAVALCHLLMAQGNVEIVSDKRLNKLMDLYKDQEAKEPTVPGYRIQILSDGNRSEVQKAKDKFLSQFPNKKPTIVYQAPNFKLRIGVYRTRLEAYKDLVEISPSYGNAFIVKDDINLADL